MNARGIKKFDCPEYGAPVEVIEADPVVHMLVYDRGGFHRSACGYVPPTCMYETTEDSITCEACVKAMNGGHHT